MNTDELAIGIDLGTTNSAIAVFRQGKAELIPNPLGQMLTPSVVSVDEEQKLLVGEAAKSRLITRPGQTAAAFKRFIGTNKVYQLGDMKFKPEELCSLVLRQLKSDAEAYLDSEISDVVISVPAYFNDYQRKLVAHSAELAGLNAIRLINEPTAACLAYSLHETHERQFLVFDLGGGTFDVTVVEHQEGFVEVHASAGDNLLGGEDFTEELIRWVCTKLELDLNNIDLSLLAKIAKACEVAKCSTKSARRIELPAPINQTLVIEAEELSELWANLLTKLSRPIRQALNDARLSSNEIDELIFVGGSSRLSEVQKMATRLLGRFGNSDIDPDLVVVIGAATQAACRLRDETVEEVILTDVCPYTLGISVQKNGQSGVFNPIIERNTVVPTSRVERFYTCSNDQESVNVSIYQGERLWVKENLFIESFSVEVPKNRAGEESIDVRFSYDINGLLEVDVTVLSSGKKLTKLIDRTAKGMDEESKRLSHERLAKLKLHPRDAIPNITLMEKLSRLYEERLSEERAHVEQLIFYFNSALESQDESEIQHAIEHIQQEIACYQ